jgi:hypothetical protein
MRRAECFWAQTQLVERSHVPFFFAIPQPCNAQRDFIFFWDPRASREEGTELFSPPCASRIDILRSCELCRALSTLGAHALTEEREDAEEDEEATEYHE